MKTFWQTHRGLARAANQDRALVHTPAPHLWVLAVADGLGGQAGGEVAAQVVVEALSAYTPDGSPLAELLACLDRADEVIASMGHEDPGLKDMGTTATAVAVQGDRLWWAHVGDSRLYHRRGQALAQLTTDQNLAQFLVEDGQITVKEARRHPMSGVLEQCVGCGGLEPETGELGLRAGDELLLCSDGLHGELAPEAIAGVMTSTASLQEKVRALVRGALMAGGRDNITVVAAQL